MQTLLLKFPGRRYHATPWGHHVNEGLIEWPPSPWRLLRALISTGYTSGLWNGDGPPAIARSLIERLAGVLPTYRLPPSVGTHSRHYMPLARFKNKREETTMVFDTWAQVAGGVLAVFWDVELSPEESSLLAALVERMSYLGRSESWVAARLARTSEIAPDSFNCFPSDAPPTRGWEQVPVMAAMTEKSYAEWLGVAVESALADIPIMDPLKKKLSSAEKKILGRRKSAVEPFPPDLVSCLQSETSWLHKHGWSQPPGSRRVFYWRPAHVLESSAPSPHSAKSPAPVSAMLLSMSTASGNNHALPSVVRTLPQAELLHRALVSFVTRGEAGFSPALIGRDETRKPLGGRHEHAHILPLDLDDDGHLDHLLVWAPMGLDSAAQWAVRSTRRTFTKGGTEPLSLAIAGSGTLEQLRLVPGTYGDGLRLVLAPCDGRTEWISLTPFVPPRFVKTRGRNTIEGQVIAELASRGLPAPREVRLVQMMENPLMSRQRHFIRTRRHGPPPPIDCGFQIQLTFSEPIDGPLCLGYASHFGLGMFAAVG